MSFNIKNWEVCILWKKYAIKFLLRKNQFKLIKESISKVKDSRNDYKTVMQSFYLWFCAIYIFFFRFPCNKSWRIWRHTIILVYGVCYASPLLFSPFEELGHVNIFIERGFLKRVGRWLASLERYYWILAILVADLCVFFKQITDRAGLKGSTDGKRLPQEYVFSNGYASHNVLLWLSSLRRRDV